MIKRIESVKNQKVKAWKKLHTKKGRETATQFLIEGIHLVEEALRHEVEIVELIICEGTEFLSKLDTKDIPVTIVTLEVMKAISETQTPQGIAAVCSLLHRQAVKQAEYKKIVLLDRIQDPGNLGTIIRTADSAGIDAVILGEGCVDLYNGKVIRATQGSLFHLPVFQEELMTWVAYCKEKEIPIYGTSLKEAQPFHTVAQPNGRFALILGNEGEGVSSELLEKTTANLYIPIYGQAESLNVSVAAGILLYHFTLTANE